MVNGKPVSIIGVGNPVVDVLARVNESLVESIPGEKGGMVLVSSQEMEALLEKLDTAVERVPGGSAGNTIFALAELGARTAMIGKIRRDESGNFYRRAFEEVGGSGARFKYSDSIPTARCLSLITPDSQRTMRTDLGAAAELSANEISERDFRDYRHAHVEGYLFFNSPELMEKALHCAKKAGCTVSLDLGSFEVVKAMGQDLSRVLKDYVDAVFANEEEAAAYCGSTDPREALKALKEVCDNAAVKLGAEGALLCCNEEQCRVEARPVDRELVLDTTGAGDLWAAGFLYAYLSGGSPGQCGRLAAALGAEAVRYIGGKIPASSWSKVRKLVL